MTMQVTISAEEVKQAISSMALASIGPGWRLLDMDRFYVSAVTVELTNDPPEKTVEGKEFESCQL